jgi:hypothetical protein
MCYRSQNQTCAEQEISFCYNCGDMIFRSQLCLVFFRRLELCYYKITNKNKQNKHRGFSPQANYIDRTTAASQRS